MNRQSESDKVPIKRTTDCFQSIAPVTACAAPLMEEHSMCSSLHGRACCPMIESKI